MSEKFYVYGHYTEDTGELFYIGKGHGGRLNHISDRTVFWKNIAKKHGWVSKIISYCESEDAAFSLEKTLILEHGRRDLGTGCLVNLTDGGEGLSGPCSEERKKVISEARKGKGGGVKGEKNPAKDPEVRRKISEYHKGVPKSIEHRKKLSVLNKGKKRPPFTQEHLQRLSEARRKWWKEKRGKPEV